MAKVVSTDFPFTVFSVEADKDYLLARMVSFLGGSFHSRAGFLSQQACEKYMKALSVQEDQRYLQTHILPDLADANDKYDPIFGDAGVRQFLKQIDYFEQVGRYGAAANFDPLSQQTEEIRTAGVMFWKHDYLYALDKFVFHVRKKLDHPRVGHDDSIKSILEGNVRSQLLGTWTGAQDLREILVRENAYFAP